MDAFSRLKAEAAAKRDTAIERARLEYRQSLAKIADLRARLGDGKTLVDPKRRFIVDLIEDVMPQDRPFLMAELITLLKRADPKRIFFAATVRTDLHKLIRRGAVRRVGQEMGKALYASTQWQGPVSEFVGQQLSTVAEALIKERGPMTTLEMVVAMRECGFRSDDEPRKVRESLMARLRYNPQRFRMDAAGRWSLVS